VFAYDGRNRILKDLMDLAKFCRNGCCNTANSFLQGYITENCTPLGPYRRPMPRVLGGSYRGRCFLVVEVPLYKHQEFSRNGGSGGDTATQGQR